MLRVRIESSIYPDSFEARIIRKSHKRHGSRVYLPKHSVSAKKQKEVEEHGYAYCLVHEHHV